MREQRVVFGEDAELYDRARPTYPSELIDEVVALAAGAGNGPGRGWGPRLGEEPGVGAPGGHTSNGPGRGWGPRLGEEPGVGAPGGHTSNGPQITAVDVGCGTGKATVLLAERGLAGVGVEADPAMAEVARRNLAGFPRWRVEVSDFEKWEPAGAGPSSFDLVSSAQAWHWLDPAVRLHKAHALLRPGGWVALWWNRPSSNGEDEDLREEIDRIYAEVAPEIASKNSIGHTGQPAKEHIPPDLPFGPPFTRCYPWEQDYSAGEWVALMCTQSDHRLLSEDRLEELTRRVREAIQTHGGTYRHRRACWLWAAQKLA